jgi:hypothetical protein
VDRRQGKMSIVLPKQLGLNPPRAEILLFCAFPECASQAPLSASDLDCSSAAYFDFSGHQFRLLHNVLSKAATLAAKFRNGDKLAPHSLFFDTAEPKPAAL